ncbi:conserved membrane hypothetical protein [uncultured Gammaproteobacteria bacterium]
MKKLFATLAVLAMLSATAPAQAGPLMRDVGQGCAFGAAVLAATTFMGLTAVAMSAGPGAVVMPRATTALVNNSLLGCGLGVVGSFAGKVMGGLYDILF